MKEELRKVFGDTVSSRLLIRYNRSYFDRACKGELKRYSAKTWDLRDNDTQEKPISKVTPKIDLKNVYQEIEKRFGMLDILGESVVQGNMNALMVAGAPGVGKTYSLEKKLEHSLASGRIQKYVSLKGAISAVYLYKTLYENKEKGNILVLDDVDVFGDEETLNILKAALDSSITRNVSWSKNSRFLEDEGVPAKFEYKGQVVFITNVNPDKIIAKGSRMSPHMNALVSRSVFLDLCIHEPAEILMRIKQVMEKSTLKDDLMINDEQADEIVEWMTTRVDRLRSVSIRTVLQISGFIKTAPENWMDIAEATLVKSNRF